MNKKNAYITTELFMKWMTQHFIPRKPAAKNFLVLDGHASHMNSADMLQVASDNDIIIVCLPSHITHYLQPLDGVVFKLFKTYFKDARGKLVSTRRGMGKITRHDFGELLNSTWSRAATVQLAISAFRATGIYPLNMDAIPEHAYLLSRDQDAPRVGMEILDPEPPDSLFGPIKTVSSKKLKLAPYKALATISPILCSLGQSKVKRKISAANDTSPEYIASKRKKIREKKEKKEQNKQVATSKIQKGKLPRGRKSKSLKHDSPPSTSSDEDSTKMELLSDTVSESGDEACVECLEIYALTTSQSGWIKCISCGKWLHESCQKIKERLLREKELKLEIINICRTAESADEKIKALRNKDSTYEVGMGKPNLTTTIYGCKVLAKYATACEAKNPDAITYTRLTKHLATLTQLFNLTFNEIEQLATFIGHTPGVHMNSYRLPDDVYQTAKISKLLLLMESGNAGEHKGKALDEININLEEDLMNECQKSNEDSDEIEVENGNNDLTECVYSKTREINTVCENVRKDTALKAQNLGMALVKPHIERRRCFPRTKAARGENLGMALVKPHIERRRCFPRTKAARDIVENIISATKVVVVQEEASTSTQSKKRGRCYMCKKTDNKCANLCYKCGKYCCKKHLEQRLEKAAEGNKKYYDLRRLNVVYEVGDQVYRKNYVQSDAANFYSALKLAPKYIGPFVVAPKISPWMYELADLDGKPLGTWHAKDLKPNCD
ncbi:DDE superfamily endonuclease [Popillia japonica]|uniref:DDE superfamily endonuclease n=1 Tax=Popillia japonica TaxID=7064 RepID=A0AAW1I8T7_POPJA